MLELLQGHEGAMCCGSAVPCIKSGEGAITKGSSIDLCGSLGLDSESGMRILGSTFRYQGGRISGVPELLQLHWLKGPTLL